MRSKNPYQRIKHGFDNFPTPAPIATLDRVGGFLLEEDGDFLIDELGHLKLKKVKDSGRVGDIVFTFSTLFSLGENWMEAAGQSLSILLYPELFNIIGYKYGGSGQNFSLPNFKENGWFVRSYSSTNAIGNIQTDAIRNITGNIGGTQQAFFKTQNPSTYPDRVGAFKKTEFVSNAWTGQSSGNGLQMIKLVFNASDSVPTAEENRPVNIAMRVLIKVK